MNSAPPLWSPDATAKDQTKMQDFKNFLTRKGYEIPADYPAFHLWSVQQKDLFWRAIVDYFHLIGDFNGKTLEHPDRMPGAQWFPESTLNFAENLLQGQDEAIALISIQENGHTETLNWQELRAKVGQLSNALRQSGVTQGDRVAGFLPNGTHAVIAMLATTSLGAIWSSCSPDFGLQGVIDRFGQIEPKVLFVTQSYEYNGKTIDTSARIEQILEHLPVLSQVVTVPFLTQQFGVPKGAHQQTVSRWTDYIDGHDSEISYTQTAFSHPLYIMYSSGTTGAPKCIVHSVGGTLLQHVKEHGLHVDIGERDRIFYYTTCGWMMWNWLVSALALKATVVLYDGSPFFPDGNRLFDIAEKQQLTVLGSSAKFYSACEKAGIEPASTHNLAPLKALLSTGSPLAHESFDYVYQKVKSRVCLSSISGGTDIISCFALGNPMLPVYRGELQCAGLGMDLAFFDDEGNRLEHGKGELVCCTPFPSMPTGFWNDLIGEKFHHAYFSRYPNIWAHGDYGEYISHPTQQGIIIHGRSDAVLNPGGVRIGTAEIYRQVEKVEEVLESVAVGQNWNNDVRIILFVKLRDNLTLDESLKARIKKMIKEGATLRHLPALIIQVPDIPRTISGKIVELAIKNLIHNEPVKNKDALANPEALDYFTQLPELLS